MVSKDHSFNQFPSSNSNGQYKEFQDTLSPAPASSSSFPNSNMSSELPPPQQHVSPYGPPSQSNNQPYPTPQHSQTNQEPQQSNHYPQYTYDIRLSYPQPQDQSRSYPPPPAPLFNGTLPPMVTMPEHNGQMQQNAFTDTTGQIAPVGVKPRVTATLWEDEGTLCFQVDVKGTCVARREDNHMINGTKLLNVAGMTRGRRDGILKSEKQKHVVKIGPMHLKGVWIPFERALEFANKEKITEMLYPLFVHNIGALLYHPINRGYPPSAQIPRSQEQLPPVQGYGMQSNQSVEQRERPPVFS